MLNKPTILNPIHAMVLKEMECFNIHIDNIVQRKRKEELERKEDISINVTNIDEDDIIDNNNDSSSRRMIRNKSKSCSIDMDMNTSNNATSQSTGPVDDIGSKSSEIEPDQDKTVALNWDNADVRSEISIRYISSTEKFAERYGDLDRALVRDIIRKRWRDQKKSWSGYINPEVIDEGGHVAFISMSIIYA